MTCVLFARISLYRPNYAVRVSLCNVFIRDLAQFDDVKAGLLLDSLVKREIKRTGAQGGVGEWISLAEFEELLKDAGHTEN